MPDGRRKQHDVRGGPCRDLSVEDGVRSEELRDHNCHEDAYHEFGKSGDHRHHRVAQTLQCGAGDIKDVEDGKVYTDDTQVYTADVYNNGIKTDDVISCSPSFIDNTIYTLESNGNSWQINYIGTKKKDLTLTFTSENTSPVDVQIRLGGMF